MVTSEFLLVLPWLNIAAAANLRYKVNYTYAKIPVVIIISP